MFKNIHTLKTKDQKTLSIKWACLYFGSQWKFWFQIWFIVTLYNKMGDIRKCNSYFFTKCDKSVNKMCQLFYYKIWQFYYKCELLRKVTTITKCAGTQVNLTHYQAIISVQFPIKSYIYQGRYCVQLNNKHKKIISTNHMILSQINYWNRTEFGFTAFY